MRTEKPVFFALGYLTMLGAFATGLRGHFLVALALGLVSINFFLLFTIHDNKETEQKDNNDVDVQKKT